MWVTQRNLCSPGGAQLPGSAQVLPTLSPAVPMAQDGSHFSFVSQAALAVRCQGGLIQVCSAGAERSPF